MLAKNNRIVATTQVIAQVTGVIGSLLIARIIGPESYGKVALILSYIVILEALINSGLNEAILQSRDLNKSKISKLGGFNVLVASVLSLLSYLVFSLAFNSQGGLIIFVSLLIPITKSLHNSSLFYSIKKRNFNIEFIVRLLSGLISTIIGIMSAYYFRNEWALIVMRLVREMSVLVILFIAGKWIIPTYFAFKDIIYELRFGIFLLGSTLLNSSKNFFTNLIIERNLGVVELGYFNRTNSLLLLPSTAIHQIMTKAGLVEMSANVNNSKELNKLIKLSLLQINLFLVPLMCITTIWAQDLIALALGDMWGDAAIYLKFLSSVFVLFGVNSVTITLLKALDMTRTIFKLEIIKNVMFLLVLAAILLGDKRLFFWLLPFHAFITTVISISFLPDTKIRKIILTNLFSVSLLYIFISIVLNVIIDMRSLFWLVLFAFTLYLLFYVRWIRKF